MSALRKLMQDHILIGRPLTMRLDVAVAFDSTPVTREVPAVVEAVEDEELSDCGLLLAIAPPFVFDGVPHGRVWACAMSGAPKLHGTLGKVPVEAELLDETREHALMRAHLRLG